VLTHRSVTAELRQKVFGDVHMLSDLVGAANRADIRRLVALERENAVLRERLERRQLRARKWLEERDRALAALEQQGAEAAKLRDLAEAARASPAPSRLDETEAAVLVALQTERRERAEQATVCAAAEAMRLGEELEQLGRHTLALQRELGAAETQLREMSEMSDKQAPPASSLDHLCRQRILYVGGQPSSTPAIRDLVLRHGGQWQRHDGGIEDRKGLLAAAVACADRVVFPVDCVDPDSAGNLKRLCLLQQVAFTPLRGSSVASFAAALADPARDVPREPDRKVARTCLKHG